MRSRYVTRRPSPKKVLQSDFDKTTLTTRLLRLFEKDASLIAREVSLGIPGDTGFLAFDFFIKLESKARLMAIKELEAK